MFSKYKLKKIFISIFNLYGHCLYHNISFNNLTSIENIVEQCVIVVVDNVAYKLLVR